MGGIIKRISESTVHRPTREHLPGGEGGRENKRKGRRRKGTNGVMVRLVNIIPLSYHHIKHSPSHTIPTITVISATRSKYSPIFPCSHYRAAPC